jgi:hypothetical protein
MGPSLPQINRADPLAALTGFDPTGTFAAATTAGEETRINTGSRGRLVEVSPKGSFPLFSYGQVVGAGSPAPDLNALQINPISNGILLRRVVEAGTQIQERPSELSSPVGGAPSALNRDSSLARGTHEGTAA